MTGQARPAIAAKRLALKEPLTFEEIAHRLWDWREMTRQQALAGQRRTLRGFNSRWNVQPAGRLPPASARLGCRIRVGGQGDERRAEH